MTKVVVTEQALREMIREAMFNKEFSGWSSNEEGPAEVNPNVDPSAAVTDPINPNFTPQDKTEFNVAIGQLVKNLPDADMPGLYDTVRTAIDDKQNVEDEDEMKKKAMQGGTTQVEEQVRKAIRKVISDLNLRRGDQVSEAKPDPWKDAPPVTGPMPAVTKIPAGIHGGEFTRWQEKNKSDVKKYLGKIDLDAPVIEPEEHDADVDPVDDPKRRAYKTTALGGMTDVAGASFEQIAQELGFSVAGAKQAVDKSLEKARFLATGMDEDDREILVLTAINDYIKTLNRSGELTPADVQLMKDHPDMVRELDGFREFLDTTIRRARRQDQKIVDPLEDEEQGDESLPRTTSSAPPSTTDGDKPVKSTYKVYPGSKKFGDMPVVTRVKGKVYGPAGETQFGPGEQGEMSVGSDGKLSVKKPGGDHTQTWDPVEESKRPILRLEAGYGSTAAKVRARKEKHPELYCSKCLWMTGGGNCPRHGGPPWTPEREAKAAALSRGEQ